MQRNKNILLRREDLIISVDNFFRRVDIVRQIFPEQRRYRVQIFPIIIDADDFPITAAQVEAQTGEFYCLPENFKFTAADVVTFVRQVLERSFQLERGLGIIFHHAENRGRLVAVMFHAFKLNQRRVPNQTAVKQKVVVNAELPPLEDSAGQYPLPRVNVIVENFNRAVAHLPPNQHVKIFKQTSLALGQLRVVFEKVARQVVVALQRD